MVDGGCWGVRRCVVWSSLLVRAGLALSFFVAGCGGRFSARTSAVRRKGFVAVEDGRLVRNGTPYRFLGANFWNAANLASRGPGGDRARFLREVDRLSDLGVTNVRVMASGEGKPDLPYSVQPALQPQAGDYDPQVFDGLDFALAEFGRRGITVVMCLNNFWFWSGGFAQYLRWNGSGAVPFPESQDDDHGPFSRFSAKFYRSGGAQQDFQRHIRTVILRKNSYTGTSYRDDPHIMAWELANEPRGMGDRRVFRQWIDESAAFIKSVDPAHLVTTGSEGDTRYPFLNGLDTQVDHQSDHIDYVTFHLWVQNWGWFDAEHESTSIASAIYKAKRYIDDQLKQAAAVGKPAVLEEFGIGRDGGSYEPASSVRIRARYFDEVLEAIYRSASGGGAASGSNFWAWAGEGRPQDPGGMWSAGDPWIGDPPHERQGWYSVYDADAAVLDVFRRHASQLRDLD